jgi:polyphosphate kinase 2
MSLPFDGAISRFFETEAPEAVREAVREGRKRDILTDDDAFPYDRWMKKDAYEERLDALQIEVMKLQHWVAGTGARVVALFEGRDAAGKGGAIRRLTLNTSPRVVRTVALPKPTGHEQGQWYFQRYVAQLPTAGEVVLFDRSWYNRGVVEKVFGFCTDAQRARFFAQVPEFEKMLVDEGIHLVKFWLNVSQAEQLRRMLAREGDPLRQWKLSRIDVDGLSRWDAYSRAIAETFAASHTPAAPWTVIRADDKYRARLAVLQTVLGGLDYAGKDAAVVGRPDPAICGDPGIWHPGGGR